MITKEQFDQMSQEDIKAMSDEEFKAISPEVKRSCCDCGWLIAVLSWWCSNEKAIEVRRTRIPGCIKCPYWKPMYKTVPAESLWAKLLKWVKRRHRD